MDFKQTVFVNNFTNAILDPELPFDYHVKDGGHIIANTAPGCWGPMITPALKGGHEVTQPVYVEGAEIGDAIAIHIENITVTSRATASGNDRPNPDNFINDPFVDPKCPKCGALNPATDIEGIGYEAIHCHECGESFLPFDITNGYTMVFNSDLGLGLTLDKDHAEEIAKNSLEWMETPENSIQNPITTLAPNDIVGLVARMRPFLGQLGTVPSQAFPDSHNAGDFGQALLGASHEYGKTEEDLIHRTDGHMDVNRVRQGAVLIAPVKVPGGGVYIGDMHAMQGNGEIAGHTTDVAGVVQLRVEVIKNLNNQGPILLPVAEDLPYLAQPFTEKEYQQAQDFAKQWDGIKLEESLPISFIGTGASLNEATSNGLERAADFLGITVPEVMNRATVTGAIEIGRLPGVVTVTFLAPLEIIKNAKLLEVIKRQYDR